MKIFLVISALFCSGLCSAQKTGFNRLATDSVVNAIDVTIGKPEMFRWLLGSYEFQTTNGNITKIIHKEKAGPKEITNVFYITKGKLIYSEEKEYLYYIHGDSSVWKVSYYFENDQLVDHVTLGHGKSETDEWDPEKEVLAAYKKAVVRIKEYQKKKN